MITEKVTAKGQITLKREMLQHLGVAPGQEIEVNKLPDGRLLLAPARKSGSINDFFGCLHREDGPRLTIEEIKQIAEEAWAGRR